MFFHHPSFKKKEEKRAAQVFFFLSDLGFLNNDDCSGREEGSAVGRALLSSVVDIVIAARSIIHD